MKYSFQSDPLTTVSFKSKLVLPHFTQVDAAISVSRFYLSEGSSNATIIPQVAGHFTPSLPVNQATSLNLLLDAPHTGHSSGALPHTVWPQSPQTLMNADFRSSPPSRASNALR